MLVDVTALSTEIEARHGGGLVDRRGGEEHRACRAIASSASVIRCSPALFWPAPARRSATWRRSAATSFSARAASISTTMPRAATSACPAPAVTRSTASTACTRSSARHARLRRDASLRHVRGAGRARRHRPHGWRRRLADRCRFPIFTDCREDDPISRRELQARRTHHRGRAARALAARSTYRKVRDRASYAFALVSVAAALDVADGKVRDVRLALGGVAPSPGALGRPRRRLRGQAAAETSFRAAAEAELADAAGLRHNEFKIELARRTITAVLGELAGGRA